MSLNKLSEADKAAIRKQIGDIAADKLFNKPKKQKKIDWETFFWVVVIVFCIAVSVLKNFFR